MDELKIVGFLTEQRGKVVHDEFVGRHNSDLKPAWKRAGFFIGKTARLNNNDSVKIFSQI